jgi:hypothetical protein
MAHKLLALALASLAASPAIAAVEDPAAPEPVANARGEYCLKVAPLTGSNVETIRCWTREEWADQDVDVDKEWAENGVVLNA